MLVGLDLPVTTVGILCGERWIIFQGVHILLRVRNGIRVPYSDGVKLSENEVQAERAVFDEDKYE